MKRFIFITSFIFGLCLILAQAQINTALLNAIKSDAATDQQWAQAMTGLADAEKRQSIQDAITNRESFPKKQLVSLLRQPQLSVRLGAIELLEDAAGGDNSYNVWLAPDAAENAEPYKMWQEWANSDSTITDKKTNKLSPEKIQSYIQQLLSNERSRITRATRMLEGDNFNAVAAIQQFIVDNPALPIAKVSQLKQVQYELVLIKASRVNAGHLARDLVKGNRDQKLTALAAMKKLGLITIPIIRDYVDDPDSLIRETSIDAILTVGGNQILPFIADRLKEEKDINVIHVAIKNLKDIGGTQALDIIRTFLHHQDEDLVIASIASMTKFKDGGGGGMSLSDEGSEDKKEAKEESVEIAKFLKDNRWRVRVAALEHIAELEIKEAGPEVLLLLKNDKDEFVRHHSIKTAVALKLKEAKGALSELYKTNDDMVASLTTAIITMEGSLSAELLAHLKTRDPDIIISSMKAFKGTSLSKYTVLIDFSKHKNIDISCAALRLLASNKKNVSKAEIANVLTDALKSKNEDKISAVLNSLELPKNSKVDPSLRYLKNVPKRVKRTKNPELDAVYTSFLQPGGKELTADAIKAGGSGATATGGLATLLSTLVDLTKANPESDQSFQIALLLTKSGDKRGLISLKDNAAKMSISKRASLADALYNPTQAESVPVLIALLQDPSKEIRTSAIKAAFSNEHNKVLMQAALNALSKEGTKITGADAYTYRTESAANDSSTRDLFYHWCVEQLGKEKLDDRTRILSLILIRKIATNSDSELLSKFTTHLNPWVRRAAWHSLGIMNSTWYGENISKLLEDPHPDVRAAITDSHTRADSRWRHIFSDTENQAERSYYSRKSSRRLSPKLEESLQKMSTTDPSESNRFEAMFTLLSHSRTVELDQFINLISKQDKDANVVPRLSSYVQRNYKKMGKGMAPLLAYVDFRKMSRRYHDPIIKHFATGSKVKKDEGFSTFAGLAKTTDASKEPQHLSTPEQDQAMAVKREKLIVIFFEKAGCKKCLQVESYLKDMKQDFPLLEVRKEFVDQTEGILLNNHLSNKLQVPSNQIRKAPAVFTSTGFLVGGRINPQDLAKLLSSTLESPEQKEWYTFKNEKEVEVAKQAVDKAYQDLTLPIVIAGGLLDGINPCAFATIIFFLSYLTIAKRSAKEIFFVGFAFILAVFLSYLSFGLLFSKALEWLTANAEYQWIRNALNYVFAGFAILVAVLSLRDWWRARQGRLEDMTLQLPSFLKKKIRSVIRENSKSSLYVFAAFGSGVAISVLELACTGQVYAPIIYKINEGSQNAITMLVIYNLAFVLPLIIIFGLAMGGMKSNALINFQKNHTAKIKLLTAILFFALAAVLLFSTQISEWLQTFAPSL